MHVYLCDLLFDRLAKTKSGMLYSVAACVQMKGYEASLYQNKDEGGKGGREETRREEA